MASNKFATMVHKNTNKITLILTYAILEWILIVLLLLNSLFSYLIIKFADYFGLKRPCLLCSRLDHIFEPANFQDSYRSLVCETHAAEISKLGYCSNHRKLAESLDMCLDCSSSSSHMDFSKKFAFFPWVKQLGVLQDCSGVDKVSENNGEVDLKCSCCGVGLDTKFYYHDYYLSKPSWEDLDHTQVGNFVLGSGFGEKVGEDDHSVKSGSVCLIDFSEEEQRTDGNRGVEVGIEADETTEENQSGSAHNHEVEDIITELEQEPVMKDDGSNVSAQRELSDDEPVAVVAADVGCSQEDLPRETEFKHLEFYIDQNDCQLIPIELMDSRAVEKEFPKKSYEKGAESSSGHEDFVLEFDENVETHYELVVEERRGLEEDVPLLLEDDREEESNIVIVESRETEEGERSFWVNQECESVKEEPEQFATDGTEEGESSFGVNQECESVKEEPEQFATDETTEENQSGSAHNHEVEDIITELEQEPVMKDDGSNVSAQRELSDDEPVAVVAADVGCSQEDLPRETEFKHLEFYIDQNDCQLIPIELMDSRAVEKEFPKKSYEKGAESSSGHEDFVLEFDENVETHYELVVEERRGLEEDVPLLLEDDREEESNIVIVESRETEEGERSFWVNQECESVKEEPEQFATDGTEEGESSFGVNQECESVKEEPEQFATDETEKGESSFGLNQECESVKEESEQFASDEAEEGESSFGVNQECHIVKEEPEQFAADETEEGESSFGVNQKCQSEKEESEQFATDETAQTPSISGEDIQESLLADGDGMRLGDNQALEEGLQMQSDENEPEVSIGTEIPDHESMDDLQTHEVPLYPSVQDDLSTSYANFFDYDYNGFNEAEENGVEFKAVTVETREAVIESHLSLCVERNYTEEDKIPDTPTSTDSFHYLHKKLQLEMRESGAEDSLDGSVISDIEAGDGALTTEKLKSALKSERKALNALYAELEEERSASAVAANQTMAMINRLQEEKAAMQMEALQYQRMMEEQSEYDQEALQLLNELMVKREKEKAELEKETEVLRKKLHDYEEKMRMMMLKKMKDSSTRSGTCSASFSNSEDSDGMSVDLNNEVKDEDRFGNHQESSNQNTPADAVIYLEESFMNFEEERLSILDQLKVLEDKLFTLSDGEEQHFEDIESIEHLHRENGNGHSDDFDYSSEGNGEANGHYKMNGKHQSKERKIIGANAKRLLPLFDATDAETEDGLLNGHEDEFDSVAAPKSVNNGGKKLAMEEEFDHVYERLHALEADREFLRHCMTSLNKGDKGLELLQEILQHLRDLRSVEQRVRNMGDDAL